MWNTPGVAVGQPFRPSSLALVPLHCPLCNLLCPRTMASSAVSCGNPALVSTPSLWIPGPDSSCSHFSVEVCVLPTLTLGSYQDFFCQGLQCFLVTFACPKGEDTAWVFWLVTGGLQVSPGRFFSHLLKYARSKSRARCAGNSLSFPISTASYIIAEEMHLCAAPSHEASSHNSLISPSLGHLVLLSLLKQSCVAVLRHAWIKYSSTITVTLIPDYFK